MIDASLILWIGALAAIAVGAFLVALSKGDPEGVERSLWAAVLTFLAAQLLWVVPIVLWWNVRAPL